MLTPKKYEEIINTVRETAEFYTPEWRYNPETPDAGTALAQIWARMHAGTMERIENLAEHTAYELLNSTGIERNPASSAQGYLCFKALPDNDVPIVVPAGTRVSATADPDAVLSTDSDLYVDTARLNALFCTSGEVDALMCYDGFENLKLFDFSQKNRREWQFAHYCAFTMSQGGMLRIKPVFSNNQQRFTQALASPDAVVWESQTQDGWVPVADVLIYDGVLTLMCGTDNFSGGLRFRILDKNAFTGAELCGIRFCPQHADIKADAVYSGDLPQPGTGFFPFGTAFSAFDTLNIACEEAFAKPGATIELSFMVRIIKQPIEGYPRPEQIWKSILRPYEIVKVDERDISISSVTWEYFNGTGWNTLPVTVSEREFFTSASEPEHRTIRFICPPDMDRIEIGAHDLRFIRAKILTLDNAYSMYGFYLAPWVENITLSYSHTGGYGPDEITITQNFDSLTIAKLNNPLPLCDEQFTETALYFRFDRPFTAGSLLFDIEESAADLPPLNFEYYTDGIWREAEINSETNDFRNTGILSYRAERQPEPLRIFGRNACWLRAVDRQGGYLIRSVKPLVRHIWENAVRATATPGVIGNREPWCYTVADSTVKGIGEVFNPLPVTGGQDADSDELTLARQTQVLSHGGMAITGSDMEFLAMESASGIIRCKCLLNTGISGERHGGSAGLVLLTEPMTAIEFDSLARHVRNRITECSPLGADAPYILKPRFVTLTVQLKVRFTQPASADKPAARTKILERLISFIDPVTGGFDGSGWDFGTLPTASQISSILRDMQEIDVLDSLRLILTPQFPDAESIESSIILPQNGKHEIINE